MPQRYKVSDGVYPHFITNTVVYWIPVFCRDDYFRIIVDSLNYCISNKGLLVHAYVIMPNHFHMICSQIDGRLSDIIRDIKRHTASIIIKKLKEDNRSNWSAAIRNAGGGNDVLWQEGFHPEQIHSKQFCEQKISYMHNNPIRAGFVANAEEWKYSSAGYYYLESKSLIDISPLEW